MEDWEIRSRDTEHHSQQRRRMQTGAWQGENCLLGRYGIRSNNYEEGISVMEFMKITAATEIAESNIHVSQQG